MKTTITIKGTHCQACKALIEEVAIEVPGVKNVSVDFAAQSAEIEYDEDLDWQRLKRAVDALGSYTFVIPNN